MTDFKKKSTVRKSMLLVTGMHRSGTSALTRVLNFSGATLPKALLAPVKGENEKGFWESQRIMEFHDELLESLGGDWNALHSVPSQWFSSDEAGFYKTKLIDLIKNEFDEFETAVIKDPRICKLSPLWNAALTEIGVAPHYIVCVRSPIEVAQSLGVRNGYSRSYSINLWFNYLTAIEKSTRGLKRVFISYDNLLADPSEVISRVDGFFDLSLDGRTDVFEEKVRAFLSSSLRHHHLDMNDVQDTPEVVKHFYSWLERQCASQAIDTDFGYELNIEEALEKSPNSDFSLLQKGVRQTEQQLNQTYSAVQKLSQQHASSTKREAEQIKDIESLNVLLQKELSQSEILENQYRQLVSQHLSLKERHVELERQNLAFTGRHLELEKKHLVLDRKCDRNDDEISRMKERLSNEADTKRNKLSSLREEHEVELQRHFKQTQILNQKLVQHQSSIELNAGMSEKLRTAEKT
ncbi:MAG: hypothetical protein JKX81_05805 [Arenicella sp.]|nr:hypothetical protein [Arenicella sp.]